jgi:uncharacterized protein
MNDHAETSAPIPARERIVPLDVLRGVALLGILSMNIRFFSMVEAAYPLPTVYGDLHGANYAVFYITALLADSKMMSIFSMLFGAGIVLMAQRQEKSGRNSWHVHVRRMLVLLCFGLVHAYAFWAGDILTAYALCGLVVFRFRHSSRARQLGIGLAMLAVGSFVPLAGTWVLPRDDGFLEDFRPTPEKIAEEVDAYRGTWRQQCAVRWKQSFYAQTVEFAAFMFWRAGGLMLVGMALFGQGVFSAGRPPRYYWMVGIAGLLVGLPAIAWGVHLCEESGWDVRYVLLVGSQFNYWGSLPVALAWVCFVMLACQTPRLKFITGPLAAVGRMALSNYLLQTLICTTLFYGHGLGWFGQVERVGQMEIVAAIWAGQLVASPLWLRCFRFGPAEWLWRTLTYGTRQAFLA